MAIDGTYNVITKAMTGKAEGVLELKTDGDKLTGVVHVMGMDVEIQDGKADGDSFSGFIEGQSPMGKMKMTVNGKVDGDKISGKLKARIGGAVFDGERA